MKLKEKFALILMEFWKVFLVAVPLWVIAFKLDDILNQLKKK
jgi:hypothetical protein